MGREKDRKLRRRQRRRRKLHKLKKRLAMANDLEERKYLVNKIGLISLNPKQDIPKDYLQLLDVG